ncbi:ankyrin [Viridothelium virens]|uniref:Ankyrin n=1 Tax=Viridothelium virens TaxID=1048519 RepID=A0A6A6H001_VIRVR|nr:ankyrin [Viridothelium virens]
MGLPVEQSEPQPQSTSSLPPEALDLATRLFDFARAGSTADLLQYLTAGIPPNLTNSKGDTLLMLAAYHGHAETVKMLLEKGADPNTLNDRGQSPLAGAVFKGSDEVVRVLFEGGGKPDVGQPNAMDSARMFRKEQYLALFGAQ